MSPSHTFPLLYKDEIASHNHSRSCYVLMGSRVFDVTDFLECHPGGGDLILEYAGKDVSEILKNENSHKHSEAAYEVLDDSFVGYLAPEIVPNIKEESLNLPPTAPPTPKEEYSREIEQNTSTKPRFAATGMSSAGDLSKETDLDEDFKTYRFLNLNKPLLMQIWNGGFSKEFYLEQIHRPRHYKGGASAPLFGNFLEPLSKTAWWVVPVVWLPPVTYGTYIARAGLSSTIEEICYWMMGLVIWTFVEYLLHRFLFHLDK